MSRSSVASIALLAAAVTGVVMWLNRAERRHHPVEEVNRWEGEGGNVPTVAVEKGNQGTGKTGRPAVVSETGSTTASQEPWPFPRS